MRKSNIVCRRMLNNLSLIEGLLAALEEIAEGKGAYSRDQLEHCTNAVESMKEIAKEAILKARTTMGEL